MQAHNSSLDDHDGWKLPCQGIIGMLEGFHGEERHGAVGSLSYECYAARYELREPSSLLMSRAGID